MPLSGTTISKHANLKYVIVIYILFFKAVLQNITPHECLQLFPISQCKLFAKNTIYKIDNIICYVA